MLKNKKYMQYANFNITFGQEEEPMLVHFEDIIYPAFTSDYRRYSFDKETCWYFSEVKVQEIDEDIILVGNIIKDTQYNVYTTLEDGKLVSNPSVVPTAPYSRFIIRLCNHRMVLVGNESKSPDIRSFQAFVKSLLDDFRKKLAHTDRPVPYAIVNIVDIPLIEDVRMVLSQAKKIKTIRLRFFPLNNDINPIPIAEAINDEMRSLDSKHASVQFTSPGNADQVINLIEQSSGLAVSTVAFKDQQGKDTIVKEGQFTSRREIDITQNISEAHDGQILQHAKQDTAFSCQSEGNMSLFLRFKDMLKSRITQ